MDHEGSKAKKYIDTMMVSEGANNYESGDLRSFLETKGAEIRATKSWGLSLVQLIRSLLEHRSVKDR